MTKRPPKRRRRETAPIGWRLALVCLRRVGRQHVLAVALFALLGAAGNVVVALVVGIPEPAVHDEFSYLLAADTFASGRLTNPTHPYWQHFETFHVIHTPTYMSKYPPAQGLVLGLGQRLFDEPIVGVWLSGAAMAAATAWMLIAWLPPAWAVVASAICTVQLCWFSYWGHSYWGGFIAATGAALALGAFRRLMLHPAFTSAGAMGLGFGLMAASRPVEGGAVGLVLISALLARLLLRRPFSVSEAVRTLTVVAIVTTASLGALGYYNWRITGSALTMPYQIHEAQYAAAPTLLFASPENPVPTYRHAEMERYWLEWGVERHRRQRTLSVLPLTIGVKLYMLGLTFCGPAVLALFGLRRASGDRWMIAAMAIASGVILLSLCTKGTYPHYVAPVAPLIYALVGSGLRHLNRRSVGTRATNWAIVVTIGWLLTAPVLRPYMSDQSPDSFAHRRERLQQQLEATPERELVFVKYGPNHNYHQEWVYNRADIDRADVVWARSMGAEADRDLVEYFADRRAWTLEVDGQGGAVLTPYYPSSTPLR